MYSGLLVRLPAMESSHSEGINSGGEALIRWRPGGKASKAMVGDETPMLTVCRPHARGTPICQALGIRVSDSADC